MLILSLCFSVIIFIAIIVLLIMFSKEPTIIIILTMLLSQCVFMVGRFYISEYYINRYNKSMLTLKLATYEVSKNNEPIIKITDSTMNKFNKVFNSTKR